MKIDPSNLDNELAQARALYEVVKGDPVQEMKCLDLIARLSHKRDQHEVLTHSYLHKNAVMALGKAIVEITIEELQAIPGYEEIVDRIVARIVPSIEVASNTSTELRAITRRES
jgi:hypothetical protein